MIMENGLRFGDPLADLENMTLPHVRYS
jgi:hypothetical protein